MHRSGLYAMITYFVCQRTVSEITAAAIIETKKRGLWKYHKPRFITFHNVSLLFPTLLLLMGIIQFCGQFLCASTPGRSKVF